MKVEVDKKPVGSRIEEAEITVERVVDKSELTGRERSLANLTSKGRPKGVPNKIPRTIREAILAATQPGKCHPDGLEGWLIDRANGGIEDRKIFGAMVSRALPIEVTGTDGGPIKIDLGWLSQRRIGYGDVVDVIPEVTPTAQAPAKGLPTPGSTDYKSDDTEDA